MTSHEIKVNLVFNVRRVVYELTWTSVLLFYSLLRRAQPTPHEGERPLSALGVHSGQAGWPQPGASPVSTSRPRARAAGPGKGPWSPVTETVGSLRSEE